MAARRVLLLKYAAQSFIKPVPLVLRPSHYGKSIIRNKHDQLPATHAELIYLPMPKLSPTMTHGRVHWLKREGDLIEQNELFFEIETDGLVGDAYKVGKFEGQRHVMEIESQEEGYLAKIFSSGKEDVPVGAPLAIICQEEDQIAEAARAMSPYEDLYALEAQKSLRLATWQAYLKKQS